MAIQAKVFPDNRTAVTVKDGDTIVVTKQNIPSETTLRGLTDVDASTLADGSVIVWKDSSSRFIVTDDISLTGSNYISGGNF
jgi:hypothetical protein